MARTSRALIATWLVEPIVIRSPQARASAAAVAIRTTHVALPNARASAEASTTPAITPTLRSTPLVRDWLRLGCTTNIAAMAANTGAGPSGNSAPAPIQARVVAGAGFPICDSEDGRGGTEGGSR